MKRRDHTCGVTEDTDTHEKDFVETEEDEEHDDEAQAPVQTIKILIVGATKVGKTSLIEQYIHHSFTEEYTPTNG